MRRSIPFTPSALALALALAGCVGLPASPAFATAALELSAAGSGAVDAFAAHGAALAQVRNGQADAGIAALSALTTQYPERITLRYDLVAVLAWENHAEAAIAAATFDLAVAPPYALEALARAYRATGNRQRALELLNLSLARAPDRLETAQTRVYLLVELGRFDDATNEATALTERWPKEPMFWELLSFTLRLQHRYVEALSAYERTNDLQPVSPQALKGRVLALSKLGAAHQAEDLSEAAIAAFSAEERRDLRHERAAAHVRWIRGDLRDRGYPQSERMRNAAPGLQQLDTLFKALDFDDRSDTANAIRFDRLVALSANDRYLDTIAAYGTLVGMRLKVPPYALRAVVEAYLQLGTPEPAALLLEAMLRVMPKEFDYRITYFYTLVDLERHSEAQQVIDALVPDTPLWTAAGNARRPNPDYIQARGAQAMSYAYADNFDTALALLDEVIAAAPANTGQNTQLAIVHHWRGWERKAEDELAWVLGEDPDDREAHLTRFHVRMARHEWEGAKEDLDTITRDTPLEPAVQRAVADYASWEKRATSSHFTAAIDQQLGKTSHDYQWNTEPYSQPLGRNWRVYLKETAAWGQVQDQGPYSNVRVGPGVEYRNRDSTYAFEVTATARGAKPGVAGALSHNFSDSWSVRASATSETSDLPARAVAANITAAAASLGGTWRQDERREISAQWQGMLFSDGNRRNDLSVAWRERWAAGPRYRVFTTLGAGVETNSAIATPYFNPTRATWWSADPRVELLQWRSGEQSVWHSVTGTVGQYAQAGYGTKPMAGVAYELRYNADPNLSVTAGVSHVRRPYDGAQANNNTVSLGIEWKF